MKQPKSILVIEDDPWFAEQLLRTLSGAGFQVRHVTDGIAGIEALDEELPDAVVLDLFLPGPNALVLLHEIQSYTDLSKIPIILCTGSAAEIPIEKLAPYGVVRVLDKETMQPADIVGAVKKALL